MEESRISHEKHSKEEDEDGEVLNNSNKKSRSQSPERKEESFHIYN